jgi:hypothetical protein
MSPSPSQTQREKTLFDSFPFRYVGGGYYRDKNVQVGESAETLHGDEVLRRFAAHCTAQIQQSLQQSLPPSLPPLNPPTHLNCIATESCQSHGETR